MKLPCRPLALFAGFTLAGAFLPTSLLASSFQVLGVQRAIGAYAYATDDTSEVTDTDEQNPPGTAPFSSFVAAQVNLGSIGCAGSGRQTSSVGPLAFHAEGAQSSYAEHFDFFGFGQASGGSHYAVQFHLESDVDVRLTGLIEAFDHGSASVILDEAGGNNVVSYFAFRESISFDDVISLPAGDYFFDVAASGSSFSYPFENNYSFASYNLVLALVDATGAPLAQAPRALAAFPNPFQLETRISVPAGSREVRIFDAAGRLVRSIQGEGDVRWDGRNEAGLATPVGVYFVRVDGKVEADPIKVIRMR